MQLPTTIDSKKNPKEYKNVCEEIRTSRMIEESCTDKEKRNFIFFTQYGVFNSPPDYNKLMTSSSSEDLDFKSQFEVIGLENSSLVGRKFEIRSQKNTEGIKKIINLLTEKDAILKKFDINDFSICNGEVVLTRFHNIEIFPHIKMGEIKEINKISSNHIELNREGCFGHLDTRTAVKIMRCNNCHKRMELDLTHIIENPLTKDYTHYICPYCGEKKSLLELIKIYEENKRNSYYWVYETLWLDKYIAQLF